MRSMLISFLLSSASKKLIIAGKIGFFSRNFSFNATKNVASLPEKRVLSSAALISISSKL